MITVVSEIDTDYLISDLIEQSCNDHLVEFVKDLDLSVADWDFTEKLYKYFKAQHKIFKDEM